MFNILTVVKLSNNEVVSIANVLQMSVLQKRFEKTFCNYCKEITYGYFLRVTLYTNKKL